MTSLYDRVRQQVRDIGNLKRDRASTTMTLNQPHGWRQWLALLGTTLLLVSCLRLPSPSPPAPPQSAALAASASSPPSPELRISQYSLPRSTVHVVVIPAGVPQRFAIEPVVAQGLELLEGWARQSNAIAALNGGFFDPANQQSTSHVIQQGEVTADPRQNQRLVGNPSLAPYLEQIFNRPEFRHYRCEDEGFYAIAPHRDPAPPGCQIETALGAGPQLLPELTLEADAFLAVSNGTVIRDPLGYNRPNARSAVGILANGDVVWVMAAQQPEAPGSSGLSLLELADFMRSLGAVTAMNLDGGSSAAIYANSQTVYGKVNEAGNPVVRPIKSMLVVRSLP